MADSATFKAARASNDKTAGTSRASEPPASAQGSRLRPAGGTLRPSQVPLVPGGAAIRSGSHFMAARPANRQLQRLRPCGAPDGTHPAAARPSTIPGRLVHDALRGSGQPLAAPVREEMQARLGAGFSDVRIHTGSAARASAAEVSARAYTSGSHVVIGEGGADKHTLAHELTHVIQQRRGAVAGTDNGNGLSVSDPADRFERAAEDTARRALAGPVTAPEEAVPCERNVPGLSTGQGLVVQRSGRGPGGKRGKRSKEEVDETPQGKVPAEVINEIADPKGRKKTYKGGRGKKLPKLDSELACVEWAVRAEERAGGPDRGQFWAYLSGWSQLEDTNLGELAEEVEGELQGLLKELQAAGLARGVKNKQRPEKTIRPFMQRSVEIFVKAHGFEIAEDDPAGWIVCHYKHSGGVGLPAHWWIELPVPGGDGERVLIQTVTDLGYFEAGDTNLRWNDPDSVAERQAEHESYEVIEVPVVALKNQHIEVLQKVLESPNKKQRGKGKQ